MSLLRQITSLLLVTATVSAATYFFSDELIEPEKEGISLENALKLDTPIWVDARPRKDFETAHAPDAILLNAEEWDTLLPDFLNRWNPEKTVIVYCSSEDCGAAADIVRRLKQFGVTDITHLSGGWQSWLRHQISE